MDHSSSTLSSSKIDQPHRTIYMSGRDRIAVENYVSKYFEKEIGFNFNLTEKRSKYYLTTYIFIGPVGKVGKILI